MIKSAASIIKQQAAQRRLDRQKLEQMQLGEINLTNQANFLNEKRSIQPKRAFLLCGDDDERSSDSEDSNETEEDRKARKLAKKRLKEQQELMDKMDGVPLSKSSQNSSESPAKKTTIFNLDSAF